MGQGSTGQGVQGRGGQRSEDRQGGKVWQGRTGELTVWQYITGDNYTLMSV